MKQLRMDNAGVQKRKDNFSAPFIAEELARLDEYEGVLEQINNREFYD